MKEPLIIKTPKRHDLTPEMEAEKYFWKRLTHEANYTGMLVGECDELITYQGSTKRKAIRKPVDTAYCIYVQRGHIYLAKLDPKEMPKGRLPLNDIHKDRRLRKNGSGKTRAVSAQL